MLKKFNLFLSLVLFVFGLNCYKNKTKKLEVFIKSISDQPIIPDKIKWDDIREHSDLQTDSFINFKTFCFHNDSIICSKA